MFPDVVFFTIPASVLRGISMMPNLSWTRDVLLVGSTLGLSLRGDLQGDIPAASGTVIRPDNVLFNLALALHHCASLPTAGVRETPRGRWIAMDEEAFAMVFEIGRKNGGDLYSLTQMRTSLRFRRQSCPSISVSRTASFMGKVVTQSDEASAHLVVVVPVILWINASRRAGFGRVAMRAARWRMFPLSPTILIVLLGIFAHSVDAIHASLDCGRELPDRSSSIHAGAHSRWRQPFGVKNCLRRSLNHRLIITGC